MRLVDHPVADGGQDLALGCDVAEQQRVVGHHHIDPRGAAAGAVDQALVREEGAQPARALPRGGGEVGAVDAAPPDPQPVEIPGGGLADVRVDDRHGGQGVGGVPVGLDLGRGAGEALELAEAGVVVVPLERAEGQPALHLARQARELMVHELVGEVVGLGRHTHRDAVAAGRLREGDQVRHGLPDAGTRLDDPMGRRRERVAHLAGHLDLLAARLVPGVHAADQTARRVLRLELVAARHRQPRELVGIDPLQRGVRGQDLGARRGEGEDAVRVLPCQVGEDGTVAPGDIGVHVGQAPHEAARQVRKRREEDAPDAAQGVHVIARAMRHRAAPEQLGEGGQLVGGQARQRDARQSERVDPHLAHAHAALDRLDEGPVERGVVGDDRASAHELLEGRDRLLRRGCGRHVGVRDAGQAHDLGRDGPSGMHEGVETVDDLASPQAGRCDLYQLVVLHGQTGRLRIEDDHVLLDQAERAGTGPVHQGLVVPDDEVGRARHHRLSYGCQWFYLSAPSAARSRAMSMSWAQASENAIPAWRSSSGNSEVSVIPGIVFVSKMTGP